jgi:hypothetical protein
LIAAGAYLEPGFRFNALYLKQIEDILLHHKQSLPEGKKAEVLAELQKYVAENGRELWKLWTLEAIFSGSDHKRFKAPVDTKKVPAGTPSAPILQAPRRIATAASGS